MSEQNPAADLLDLKLLPAWVKESPNDNLYADFAGEEGRERVSASGAAATIAGNADRARRAGTNRGVTRASAARRCSVPRQRAGGGDFRAGAGGGCALFA